MQGETSPMNRYTRCLLSLLMILCIAGTAQAERIKDLVSIQGVRSNQLVGYGLVVGLDGSGDQTSQTPFTVQSMKSMLGQLGITVPQFLTGLPAAVPTVNLWLGVGKGVVFGALIALVACHFGLRIKPNTESLSSNTTASVVTAITAVILVDAVFAVATRQMGMPG